MKSCHVAGIVLLDKKDKDISKPAEVPSSQHESTFKGDTCKIE
jgi:hypothetical protein